MRCKMKEKIKKILRWLYWNSPIITTRAKQEEAKELSQRLYKIRVTPAIHSLQELRKNTWDVERVDRTINWLKNKFNGE